MSVDIADGYVRLGCVDATRHSTKGKIMLTVLADGKTISTSKLDAMFAEAEAMPTKDAFGRTDILLSAKQCEAMGNAFEMRHREFGDSAGAAGEWFCRASKYYESHAKLMLEQARNCWAKMSEVA